MPEWLVDYDTREEAERAVDLLNQEARLGNAHCCFYIYWAGIPGGGLLHQNQAGLYRRRQEHCRCCGRHYDSHFVDDARYLSLAKRICPAMTLKGE
jgi:hypothetical protein